MQSKAADGIGRLRYRINGNAAHHNRVKRPIGSGRLDVPTTTPAPVTIRAINMARTLGHHYVKSGHGLWLPGDERGHWSEAWDDQIGFMEPHMLHEGDPVRLRMAQERMKHPPVRFSDDMIAVMIDVIDECRRTSPWSIEAASIESTHMHLLITASALDIHRTAKWLAQRMTKAIHQRTNYVGPVLCKGNWCEFIFDDSHWRNVIAYIERHNVRRGMAARPYPFLAPHDVAAPLHVR